MNAGASGVWVYIGFQVVERASRFSRSWERVRRGNSHTRAQALATCVGSIGRRAAAVLRSRFPMRPSSAVLVAHATLQSHALDTRPHVLALVTPQFGLVRPSPSGNGRVALPYQLVRIIII